MTSMRLEGSYDHTSFRGDHEVLVSTIGIPAPIQGNSDGGLGQLLVLS